MADHAHPVQASEEGSASAMIGLRSVLFNLAFYLHMVAVLAVVTPVYFLLPQHVCMAVVAGWARRSLWLARVICRLNVDFRGIENLPKDGRYILAGKHQSLWETFALFAVIENPAFVTKRELLYVPIWGWWAWKAQMIYVTRGARSAALKEIADGSRRVLAKGRPIIIFPEGTRKPTGAPAQYKYGVVHLYGELGVPVVPAALNSGLYWLRRRFMRFPGTIVVSFLPPILPGLNSRDFLDALSEQIEAESDRLLLEADAAIPRPPFGPVATVRLAEIKAVGRP